LVRIVLVDLGEDVREDIVKLLYGTKRSAELLEEGRILSISVAVPLFFSILRHLVASISARAPHG